MNNGRKRKVLMPKKAKAAQKKTEIKNLTNKVRTLQVAKNAGYAPGLLGNIGSTVGSFFGGPLGAGLGRQAGSWLGKITGMGAYKVNSNTLLSDTGPPVFRDAGDGAISIVKREFIADITGSTNFTIQNKSSLNPGLSQSFPFLSQLAQNFETYELKGMVYEFKSTSASALNSTNTALGTVIMSTNYDVLDSDFASKQQMEAYQFTTSSKPSESMLHPVECDPSQNVMSALYVRSGGYTVSGDQRFYDHGNFYLATSGMQAAAVLGELWVSYHVVLRKPKIPTPIGSNLLMTTLSITPVNATSSFGASTNGGTLNTLGATATANTLTIPLPGRYLVTYTVTVATTFTRGGPFGATAGAAMVTPHGSIGSQTSFNAGNGGSSYTEWGEIDIILPNAGLTMSAPTIVGALVLGICTVTQINGGGS